MKFLKSMSLGLLPNTLALGQGPCDIYEAAKTPCVAAHSMTRALYSSYGGSLYLVKRASDNATLEIGVLDGYADSAKQDDFCGGSDCTVEVIYDQSPNENHIATAAASVQEKNPIWLNRSQN